MKPTDEQVKVCGNWLNYEAVRQTVKEHAQRWGSGEDAQHNLSELNITKNCMECNLKPSLPGSLGTLAQIAELFKDPILTKLESVGMVRKCFKQER